MTGTMRTGVKSVSERHFFIFLRSVQEGCLRRVLQDRMRGAGDFDGVGLNHVLPRKVPRSGRLRPSVAIADSVCPMPCDELSALRYERATAEIACGRETWLSLSSFGTLIQFPPPLLPELMAAGNDPRPNPCSDIG
jgi:hypothetical protein